MKKGGDIVAEGIKIVTKNSKAFHDYNVEERFETGLVLVGTEVKSIRQGKVNLKDSYCLVQGGEIFVHGMHVSPYEQGNIFNKDPIRPRKLLMHKKEINKIFAKIKQDGYAVVPLKIYFKNSKLKLEIGLAKGKKNYDKRDAAAAKDAKREIDRNMKNQNQRY